VEHEARSDSEDDPEDAFNPQVDNGPIATSFSTSSPIAASIPTPASTRKSPLSVDWEAYKAWLKGSRSVDFEDYKPLHKGELAPLKQKQATTKKKTAPRQKREFWEYYDPALHIASKYWDVGVEGKRRRTLTTPSYVEHEARSDSEDDPEDAFNPQTAVESSSESDNEPIAKKLVSPPSPPEPPFSDYKQTSPLLCRKYAKNQSQRKKSNRRQACLAMNWVSAQ
jgi:hypothetical protein